ncbi:MAG TPA: NADH-quinone oxidoreductase subunit NuoK [Bacteroidota bacterium]|jgi:NADH-quinone oxidoreductase subunit K
METWINNLENFIGWLPQVQLAHFLLVSAALFSLGLYAIITRRNAILLLMGIELVLNAANINLIAFSRYNGSLDGQTAAIFVIILAAAEAAVALAIVLNIFHRFSTVNVDEVSSLKE